MGLFDRLKACFFDKDNGDAEQLKQAATTPNPNAFSMPERPDRFVEGPNDFRADPTWETVEWYLEKALSHDDEHVILQLSYPNIPFIQAARIPGWDKRGKMSLEASVFDERTKRCVLLEKIVDDDECKVAFRLYFESGKVRDLDAFSPM